MKNKKILKSLKTKLKILKLKLKLKKIKTELKVAPEEHPVMVSEPIQNPTLKNEKTFQMLFETFSCPAVYLCPSTVLAIYATGRTTATIINFEHQSTEISCIYEGKYFSEHMVNFGSSTITDCFDRLLKERGYHFEDNLKIDLFGDLNKQTLYFPLDYQSEIERFHSSSALDKVKKNFSFYIFYFVFCFSFLFYNFFLFLKFIYF